MFFSSNEYPCLYNDILNKNLNISKIVIYQSFPALAYQKGKSQNSWVIYSTNVVKVSKSKLYESTMIEKNHFTE